MSFQGDTADRMKEFRYKNVSHTLEMVIHTFNRDIKVLS